MKFLRLHKANPIIGYTTGVFDLFHIGHLNLLRNAKQLCDKLIVGVSSDELVSCKHKKAVIPFEERIEMIRSNRYVDVAVPQYDMDKLAAWNLLKFHILFVGDDWHKTEKWKEIEKELEAVGVKVIYFPYTKGVSSSLINDILKKTREELIVSSETSKRLLQQIVEETRTNSQAAALVEQYLSHISSSDAKDH